MRDPAFTPAFLDQLWRKTLPDAAVTQIDDAGHFVQEDAPERTVPGLLSFLSEIERERAASHREGDARGAQ
jgi:pimeloyl-ACP methyl ester carboxylesterase